MLLKFPKVFRDKESDSELSEKDIVVVNSLEQNSEELSEPTVTEGRVTIHFTSVSPADGALLVGFFVSNGYSQKVKFGKVPLVLLDSEKKVLAEESFSGDTIGVVAGGSTKACVVRFQPDHVYTQDIPAGCEVCFDVRPKRRPSVKVKKSLKIRYQMLPEDIPVNQQQELERVLEKLPPIKRGEVNLAPLCATITPQRELIATVIIRNAANKPINVEQIPLAIYDAQEKELAHGIFDVKGITIEPFKAILWTFNFKDVLQDRDIDLSSWHINVLSR